MTWPQLKKRDYLRYVLEIGEEKFMAIQLENIVPFGRTLAEYIRLFSLSETDLEKSILGVGDGPASFNAEMRQLGRKVVSVDPIYGNSALEIETRFNAVADNIIEQVKNSLTQWQWSYFEGPEALRQQREQGLKIFLQDYQSESAKERYIQGELPNLNFADDAFDLVLCSHLLFLYSDHLDLETHLASIRQMLTIGKEVRLFPLLTLAGKRSPYLDTIINTLSQDGHHVSVEAVDYEFQKGANEMLKILRYAPL